MTWVEASAMRVPVVASRIGGPGEYIQDGVTGLLAATGDAADFAEKILNLYNAPELREKLSLNGRKEVEKFYNWDFAADKTRKLIEKIISGIADQETQSKD
jgi:glycosyltransferase involved in cell wall biosynthesis